MFLSRIELNCSKRETQKALVAVNRIHGAVEAAFPQDRGRKLWRLDDLQGKKYLMILSESEPNFSGIQSQLGFEEKEGEIRDYSALLNRIEPGTRWRFRLTANPTYSKAEGENLRGKVHSEVSEHYMYEWLFRKSEANGFLLDPEQLNIRDIRWHTFMRQGKHKIQFKAVTFEGILTITDAEKMKYLLTHGLGREKAYGMGMMTVIHC